MQALYQSNRDLISVGAYQAGANPQLDAAVQHYPALQAFLAQDMHDPQDLPGSLEQLARLVGSFHLPSNPGDPGE